MEGLIRVLFGVVLPGPVIPSLDPPPRTRGPPPRDSQPLLPFGPPRWKTGREGGEGRGERGRKEGVGRRRRVRVSESVRARQAGPTNHHS